MRRGWMTVGLLAVLLMTLPFEAQRAQRQRGMRGGWFFGGAAVNPPYDGRLTFTRIRYDGAWGRGSNSWNHDYPYADRHLSLILNELTSIRPNLEASNILDLEDPEIFRQPILYIWEPGYWGISEGGAANLRDYMLKGGFVIFDDFEEGQWDNFEAQFRLALPQAEFMPLDLSHPIYHVFFSIDQLNLPHPFGNVVPGYYGVFEDNDPTKRMMALVNHNADIAEYWEYSDRGFFPVDLTNDAYKLGVNYFVYGLTH
jgi:hypothetical protein